MSVVGGGGLRVNGDSLVVLTDVVLIQTHPVQLQVLRFHLDLVISTPVQAQRLVDQERAVPAIHKCKITSYVLRIISYLFTLPSGKF